MEAAVYDGFRDRFQKPPSSPVHIRNGAFSKLWNHFCNFSGEYSRIFPSFSRGIFGHVTRLDQSRASEKIWWII